MLPKLFAAGLGIMGGATAGLGLFGPLGSTPGLPLLLEFTAFLGLFPALMGLFVAPADDESGRRIADRESRAMWSRRSARGKR